MELPPTLVTFTGHGLCGIWAYDEPWLFDTVAEHDAAARLARGWQHTLRTNAEAMGWSVGVDNVGSLAQLTRVPGSFNRKRGCGPVMVQLLQCNPGRRYTTHQLDAAVTDWGPPQQEHPRPTPTDAAHETLSGPLPLCAADRTAGEQRRLEQRARGAMRYALYEVEHNGQPRHPMAKWLSVCLWKMGLSRAELHQCLWAWLEEVR